MGVTVALAAQNSGHQVYWASAGRSTQTRERADKIALIDAEFFANLCETCSILICVCPPGAAEDVADQVAAQGFLGLYIDANTISPQRAQIIALTMQEAGISFVDGSIIGGPAWKPNTTR